jgi:hypothetical protein
VKYPSAFWPGRFDDATWVGLLNWYLLRWIWVRLFMRCDTATGDVESIGLLLCHPKAHYHESHRKDWARVVAEWRL